MLGVLPLYLVSTRPAPLPKRVCWGLYHAGIATLTVGSLISGALEIYGTTSPLIVVYWIAGAALTLLGGLLFFTRVIREYGEEKWAARIAAMICEHRTKKPMETTYDLVDAVDAAIPKAVRRKDDGHPARRTFQAVRIAVNDELAPLEQALKDFASCLKPGGRFCVITFHSLEDRIVKNCFRTLERPCICPPKAPVCTCGRKPSLKVLAGGVVVPTKEETERNPRARSAKLRVAEKIVEG